MDSAFFKNNNGSSNPCVVCITSEVKSKILTSYNIAHFVPEYSLSIIYIMATNFSDNPKQIFFV